MRKLINDYKIYLDELERLSRKLDDKQKQDLFKVIESQLILLVAFKKQSNLGCISLNIFKKD